MTMNRDKMLIKGGLNYNQVQLTKAKIPAVTPVPQEATIGLSKSIPDEEN